MKEIPLTQGRFAQIDDEDFEKIQKIRWSYSSAGHGYAVHGQRDGIICMHRIILDAPVGLEVDHVDGNGLNNQKANLRLCTHSDNMLNKRKYRNNHSGFKGVNWHNHNRRWEAKIRRNGARIHLGYFQSAEEAARAYDAAAVNIHGQFASTNFPQIQATIPQQTKEKMNNETHTQTRNHCRSNSRISHVQPRGGAK